MGNKDLPWERNGWVTGSNAGGGRQGRTYFARRIDEPADQFNYVLKELRRQRDADWRRRIHIESESLRVLGDIPGIAKLVDSNTKHFSDISTELYVVTDRVHGTSLNNLPVPVDLPTALRIVVGVLNTIERCHAIPVLHRDIKPTHVILRENDVGSPVLIDFGLAFNESLEAGEQETASNEDVGNRFIILPEQLHGGGKRDPRSDVTQVVGLLYHLLTGNRPGLIASSNRQRPHERDGVIFSGVTDLQQRQLRRIFDSGFEWDIERRWSTSASLKRQLTQVLNNEDSEIDRLYSSRLEQLARRVNDDPTHTSNAITKAHFEHLIRQVQGCVSDALRLFPEQITIAGGPHYGDFNKSYSVSYMVSHVLGTSTHYSLTTSIERDGQLIQLNGYLEKNSQMGFLPPPAPNRRLVDGMMKTVPSERPPNILDMPTTKLLLLSPETKESISDFVNRLWADGLEKVLFSSD